MKNNEKIEVSTRDKILISWQNSMELVRDFKNYSEEIKDNKEVSKLFSDFALEEGIHAAEFRRILSEYQD